MNHAKVGDPGKVSEGGPDPVLPRGLAWALCASSVCLVPLCFARIANARAQQAGARRGGPQGDSEKLCVADFWVHFLECPTEDFMYELVELEDSKLAANLRVDVNLWRRQQLVRLGRTGSLRSGFSL